MEGRASGVWRAALWKSTMEPGCTLEVTRWVISPAEMSFQSRLSPSQTGSSPWGAGGAGGMGWRVAWQGPGLIQVRTAV